MAVTFTKDPKGRALINGKPMLVAGWNILIRPKEPKRESEGGIALPSMTQQREEITCTVGQVVDCGPTALEGKTSSGIPLCKLAEGIETPVDLIGQWLMYARYTGHRVRLIENGALLHIITATEVQLILPGPDVLESAI